MNIVFRYNDCVSRDIRDMTINNVNDVSVAIENLKTKTLSSVSNRLIFYKLVNPELSIHEIYNRKTNVNEIERMSWTRLRLSSHSLAIEKGRWNRRGRGRLPIEERLCPCGQVQTESHIIEECIMSTHIRQTHNFATVNDLMNNRSDYKSMCSIVHALLSLY